MSTSIVVSVPAAEAELAADVLWALGVVAVEERDAPGGVVELWSSVGQRPEDIARAREALHPGWGWRTVEVDDDVANTWRAFAAPTQITPSLVVSPAWAHTAPADPAVLEVRIDPGSAFGLGDHPTTVLTLRAMVGVLRPGHRVLDVGCGSGVLGITACLLGAAAATAIDIADAAVAATTENAARNGVAQRCAASTTPVTEIGGTFDVVLANVLAPALIDMADDLRRVTAPGGTLVISGILAERHDHVLAALAPMDVVGRLVADGWTAISLAHPGGTHATG